MDLLKMLGTENAGSCKPYCDCDAYRYRRPAADLTKHCSFAGMFCKHFTVYVVKDAAA